ncbi:MAG: HD domain-containing protein [Candidatus Omnitrophica bacterium]|nr:HD domain-containing protein [Candidatus Omnitrophota bacterium]
MVRFIDMIRRDQGDHNDTPDKRYYAPVEEAPVQDKSGHHISKERASVYHDLLMAARSLIIKAHEKREINEEDVFPAVTAVVDIFIKDVYNDLLLLSYAYSKNDYLVAHIANVLILAVGFGRSIGLGRDELLKIGACALCHDLGMVEHSVLVNRKKDLSAAERKKVQHHSTRSADLAKAAVSEDLRTVIKEVHERENGRGAPEGLEKHEITAWAKIIAICDVYEALTHPRVYRPFYNPHQALRKIIDMKKDGLFDEICVKKFIEFLAVYPVGTLVRLNTGETAMVIRANTEYVTKPVIKILVNADGDVPDEQRIIDLAHNSLVHIECPLERGQEHEVVTVLEPRGEPAVVM